MYKIVYSNVEAVISFEHLLRGSSKMKYSILIAVAAAAGVEVQKA
jgi:hypothetical protein